MVCTAPAEPALPDWLDADAATGPAASSTPPMPAAVAALVLNLCVKLPFRMSAAGAGRRRPSVPGASRIVTPAAESARKRPADCREPRRRPSAQREDTATCRPAQRRPVSAAASSGTLLASGSTRGGSANTAALATARAVAPPDVTAVRYEGLPGLPAFNPDHDGERVPGAVAELRREIATADAVLFCTPE
jgi:NADPH-dependent FMN reductase